MSCPYSLLKEKSSRSPESFAGFLKHQGKVFWSPEEQFWVISDYAIAERLLKGQVLSADRSPFFAVRHAHIPPSMVSNFLNAVGNMMVTNDAPRHTALRKLGMGGISDHVLDNFRQSVEDTTDFLLARLEDRARFDFVKDIAVDLPSIVLAELFCVSKEDRDAFYTCANHMTQFFGSASDATLQMAQDAEASAVFLKGYFKRAIDERRASPRKDYIGQMMQHSEAIGLSEDEITSQATMMLVAGKVTTTDQMANNMFLLLDKPENGPSVWTQVAANLDRLALALEEATRLDPSVNFVFRTVKEDLSLEGQHLKAGDTVFISAHAVNRDADVFFNPDEFSLNRSKNLHFSYGHGSHICLGARLARLQMNILFGKLLRRYPSLRLESVVRKHQSLGFSGFESMVVDSHIPI